MSIRCQVRRIAPVLVLLLFASVARADAIFAPSYALTNDPGTNDDGDIATAMSQVRLTAIQYSAEPNYIGLKFTNHWLNPALDRSVITDIWIDNGTFAPGVLGLVDNVEPDLNPIIEQSAGVNFDRQATPYMPPGSSTLTPSFDMYFSADSVSPVSQNGIGGPGEYLIMKWQLAEGKTYYDAVRAISTGELRIAVKVQNLGLKGEGSETLAFVPLPEAAAGGLMLLGLVGGWRRRCASRHQRSIIA